MPACLLLSCPAWSFWCGRRRKEEEEKRRKRLLKARADTAAQVRLMLPMALAKRESEAEVSGLIIRCAR